jgi:hypothetical protein
MTRTIGFAVGLVLLFCGCYNTDGIKNGGLICNSGTVACPDGFVCKSDRCWKNGTGPAADAGGTNPDTAAPGSDAAVVACTLSTPPYGPFATCTSAPNLTTCDPVCQSGCDCGKRCVFNLETGNSFTCETTSEPANFSFVDPVGQCNPPNNNACAPGSVCIGDDVCGNLCYKTCRAAADCGLNSRCTQDLVLDSDGQTPVVPNAYLCSPPIESCNPTGAAACANARANFNCVFIAGLTDVKIGDSTTCDCATLHSVAIGGKCSTTPDDCQPGAACVNGACRRLCNLKATASPCPTGAGVCTAIYGSTQYGYCL